MGRSQPGERPRRLRRRRSGRRLAHRLRSGRHAVHDDRRRRWQRREGFEQPVVFWVPSIAVSGMAFYTGTQLPKWKGDVFVGGMRTGEIPGTGHLERILFNENMEELRRESLLVELRQRIRDVRQGPDELLYLLTDAEDGAVLRIEPTSRLN